MAITDTPSRTRDASLPRLGLAWVAWRQHRFALYCLLGMLACFAVLMVVGGLQARSTYDHLGLDQCTSYSSGRCRQLADDLFTSYATKWPFLFLLLLPGAFGAFLGGPLIARELETGTYRFAWTQAAGRTRWLLIKLTLIAVALAVVAGAFGALYTWYNAPLDRVLPTGFGDYLSFEMKGIVFPVQTLLAFVAGVFAGLLIRRTMVAVGTVFLGTFGLLMATSLVLRKHYMAALTTTGKTGARDWVVGTAYADPTGHPLGKSESNSLYMKYLADLPSGEGLPSVTYRDWLDARHYTIVTSYHPAGRFWSFQLIEAGWMGLLALILAAATIWQVRRKIG